MATPGFSFFISGTEQPADTTRVARKQDFAHSARLSALILDRLADAELQHGHHARAEQLAHRAAELRGAP